MTKEELERYLEIKTVLKLHEIEVGTDGFMTCPFHANCEGSLKLYEELNGVACMRESCSNYRKVFAAFEVLQELKGCKVEEARMYGKSLLLRELESYRNGTEKGEVKGMSREVNLFYRDLKLYLGDDLSQGFKLGEIRKELNISKSSLQRYMKVLEDLAYTKIVGGNKASGYDYQLVKG